MSLRNVRLLASATFVEVVRHRALWAILVLAVLLTMGNIVFTTLFSWDLGKVSIEFGLSAISFSGLLLIFFLGMKIMADDLERSRIYMILSRPVSIGEYIWGKYLGLALVLLASGLILGVSAAFSMGYVLAQYPAFVPPDFSWQIYVMALGCQWLGLLLVLALAFFWFSLSSSSFVALIFSVLSYMVAVNLDTFRYVIEKNSEAGLLAGQEWLVKTVSWLLPNLSLFNRKHEASYGLPFPMDEFALVCCYGLSYIVLLLFFATLLYKRKELAS